MTSDDEASEVRAVLRASLLSGCGVLGAAVALAFVTTLQARTDTRWVPAVTLAFVLVLLVASKRPSHLGSRPPVSQGLVVAAASPALAVGSWRLLSGGGPPAPLLPHLAVVAASFGLACCAAWLGARRRPWVDRALQVGAWGALVAGAIVVVGVLGRAAPPPSPADSGLYSHFLMGEWRHETPLVPRDADFRGEATVFAEPGEGPGAGSVGPFGVSIEPVRDPEGYTLGRVVLRAPGMPDAGVSLSGCALYRSEGARVAVYEDLARERLLVRCASFTASPLASPYQSREQVVAFQRYRERATSATAAQRGVFLVGWTWAAAFGLVVAFSWLVVRPRSFLSRGPWTEATVTASGALLLDGVAHPVAVPLEVEPGPALVRLGARAGAPFRHDGSLEVLEALSGTRAWRLGLEHDHATTRAAWALAAVAAALAPLAAALGALP